MASASYVKSKAHQLAAATKNAEVKQLAELLRDLAADCERIEKKADDAQDDANRAKRR